MAAVKLRKPAEYLRAVTSQAVTYGAKSDDVLDLTEAVEITPREWAWAGGALLACVYIAVSVLHFTISIIQWALS